MSLFLSRFEILWLTLCQFHNEFTIEVSARVFSALWGELYLTLFYAPVVTNAISRLNVCQSSSQYWRFDNHRSVPKQCSVARETGWCALAPPAVPSCLHALGGGEEESCPLCHQRETRHGQVGWQTPSAWYAKVHFINAATFLVWVHLLCCTGKFNHKRQIQRNFASFYAHHLCDYGVFKNMSSFLNLLFFGWDVLQCCKKLLVSLLCSENTKFLHIPASSVCRFSVIKVILISSSCLVDNWTLSLFPWWCFTFLLKRLLQFSKEKKRFPFILMHWGEKSSGELEQSLVTYISTRKDAKEFSMIRKSAYNIKSCTCYHFGLLAIFVLICLLHSAAQSPGGSHHWLLIRRLPAGHGRGPAEAASRHLSAGVRQAGPETRVSHWTLPTFPSCSHQRK